jgi:hypothetical protein
LPNGNYVPVTPALSKRSTLPPPAKATTSYPITISSGEWDGWPNGDFDQDFSWKEFEDTSNLRVHWAVRTNGGDRRGSEHAESWERGKKSSRRCLGIIECDNPTCTFIVRPHTSPQGIQKQLNKTCNCGAVLKHQKCEVISYLWRWCSGVHYSNGGFHRHRRPTHLLHLSREEEQRFSNNTRNRQELQVAAEHLLKGCREHYRAGVTRISRISGAVPPGMADEFKKRALTLLDLLTSEEFISQAALLVRDFPKLGSWMEWWVRPVHASMLFESERKMDIELWQSLPSDNNAEEAMHWKLYKACGRDHEFLEGMYALFAFAVHYERLFEAASSKS